MRHLMLSEARKGNEAITSGLYLRDRSRSRKIVEDQLTSSEAGCIERKVVNCRNDPIGGWSRAYVAHVRIDVFREETAALVGAHFGFEAGNGERRNAGAHTDLIETGYHGVTKVSS